MFCNDFKHSRLNSFIQCLVDFFLNLTFKLLNLKLIIRVNILLINLEEGIRSDQLLNNLILISKKEILDIGLPDADLKLLSDGVMDQVESNLSVQHLYSLADREIKYLPGIDLFHHAVDVFPPYSAIPLDDRPS